VGKRGIIKECGGWPTQRACARSGVAGFAVAGLLLGGLLTLASGTAQAQAAPATPVCELDRPVNFAGQNWESNLVLMEIERFIMEKGYGCRTDALSVEAIMAMAALENGDLDVIPEVWTSSLREAWYRAVASGKVQRFGDVFIGHESWFIPRYTAEKFPGLRRVTDLPDYKAHFRDPEDPGKGRIYGCPAGWFCEIINGNLYKALGLQDSFNLFSPGSGPTQKAAVTSAYQRKEDIVFYYWEPTPLIGALDLVALEFPPYDAEAFQCLIDPDCADPKPSAFAQAPVFTAVSSRFVQDAPKLAAFLSKVQVPVQIVNRALAYMEDQQAEPEAVALWFLQNAAEVWTPWVPADVAARVKAAL